MGISSAGIGSGIDVESIITKLMAVEAAPLSILQNKTATYQTQISALGTLSSALGTFQGSLATLSASSSYNTLTATSNQTSVLVGTASSTAVAGTYRMNVTQVAQAQTLTSSGAVSTKAAVGTGNATTVTFQLGTVSGGSFGLTGTTLGTGVLTGGITPGALQINGTTIITDSSVKSAKLLADAVNAKSDTTGVTATAKPTTTSATLFSGYGAVDTSGGGTYALTVGGVTIASQDAGVAAGAGLDAAGLDTALASDSVKTALAEANITVSGTAAGGDLAFTNADGSNVNVAEVVGGTVSGGRSAGANSGSSVTAQSSITLVSTNGSQITVGGSNPGAVGLTAGTGGAYIGASFSQDADQSSGSITIDSTNNTLEGIRDAINKGGFGVTATIINDGSANPNHLVLTSTATGASSTMKITLNGADGGAADTDLSTLLGYDPSGVQGMTQSAAAQDSKLTINGIAVTSPNTSVTKAIPGVTLTLGQTGTANLVVARDTSTLSGAVSAFVTAYNVLNTQVEALGAYDATTKTGGPLVGDTTLLSLQAAVRRTMTASISGLAGNLTSLSQVGIAYEKDGSLSVDTTKLGKAIDDNFNDIAGLFAVFGEASDSDVSFTSSTSATQAGTYALSISKMASQGTLAGTAVLGATTTIAAGTTWQVTLNDTDPSTGANTSTITIPPGTYSPSALASLVQSSINGGSKFSSAGSAVNVSIADDGTMKIVSAKYGSKSNLAITAASGTDPSALLGTASPVVGNDVEGTIGGYAATGDGQTLTGAPGAPISGLKLTVADGTTGGRGSISFSQGYAYQLNNLVAGYLGGSGLIASRTTGINSSISDISDQETAFNARLVTTEARYRAQYTSLDTTIASMNTTATFLTQQFAAIAAQG